MQLILVSRKHGQSKVISPWIPLALIVTLLIAVIVLSYNTFQMNQTSGQQMFNSDTAQLWQAELNLHKQDIAEAREFTEEQIDALTVRVARLQSQLSRLDALGEHLVDVGKLDKGEFDFSIAPAVGGPNDVAVDELLGTKQPDFIGLLDDLENKIEDRTHQLTVLNDLLEQKTIKMDTFISGRPIRKGWLSSRYGPRNDPFTGKAAWHDGIDFAGKEGDDIISVATGVVTWAGYRSGYGNLVEVNHGSGFTTRYAHAKEVLVSVGDIVDKGAVVALLGNTGRSTGPHVHFEVRKDGKSLDPKTYVNRKPLK